MALQVRTLNLVLIGAARLIRDPFVSFAGFGYEPDAIHLGMKSELFNAFNQLFGSFTGKISFLENMKRFFPVLSFIVSPLALSLTMYALNEHMS